ncbi:N-acetylmuramoyl-L-alanine amidase [Campylobacter suis]|uniref:N-acetylmuramoyl-L-alanine amidase n=1 Tax=Campylobacter suis TaxID=2790657 RepID=A0ABN7K6E1_9BACT|nr:N-acetylmuramoyl-L-alanine amidase [Campylobacter suis]CAD7286405.1 hypothetical protein LMG8286_00236 [Campylobacter suis]
MRKIFILLLMALSLFASSAIERFDTSFDGGSKNVKTKIHEDLKKLYMNAILKSDNALKMQTLTRLIQSSKALGLNSSGYENDLKKLGGRISGTKNSSQSKPSNSSRLYLLSASKGDNVLNLKFNQEISSNELKIFTLNNNNKYRNVIDIKGVLNGKGLTYKNFLVDEIRIGQFDKSTVRIVFSDTSQSNIDIQVAGNMLILTNKKFVNNAKQSSSIKDKATTKPKQQSQTKQAPLAVNSNKKIPSLVVVIDPGHGGNDPGAVNGNLKEKIAVLAVSKKLAKELQKQGHKVYFTRNTDIFINLRSRTKFANDKMADLFISVHANAAPNAAKAKTMDGIETFFLSPARSERSKNAAALENKSDIEEMNYFSQQTFLNFLNREKIIASNKLAIDVQRELLKNTRARYKGVSDGGVREAPFWVLVGALMPAVLVEIGYITHPVEGPRLYEDAYQNALAKGIADGVAAYFRNNKF